MKEASLTKFYFVRFFFLAFSLVQCTAAAVLFFQFEDTPKNRFAIFVFFTLALIFYSIHVLFFSRVRRVALSKKKVAVIGYKTKRYEWSEVKELKLMPFLNLYSLKLKGKPKIYFLSTSNNAALFGLFPDQPGFMTRKMSKA